MQQNRSEIARIIELADAETLAARQGLYGTAIVARHEVITNRYRSFRSIDLLEGKDARTEGKGENPSTPNTGSDGFP